MEVNLESMEIVDSGVISKNIWGLQTNQFHTVNLICFSPNFWGRDRAGNEYLLFMLQGCKNPQPVRGFHNEHLTPELREHRKVLEILGQTRLIEPSEKQLAGVGFNTTVRDTIIVRAKGTHNRVMKINI